MVAEENENREEHDEQELKEQEVDGADLEKTDHYEEQEISGEPKKESENLVSRYKKLLKKEARKEDEDGDGLSDVDRLKEVEANWGMRFSDASIRNSTFIIHQSSSDHEKKEEDCKNLLGTMSDMEILEWASEHYQEYAFAVFMAVCIMDCQPYEDILQMAVELKDIFKGKKDKKQEETNNWNYKSQIKDMLGVVMYRDLIYVRGIEQETDFLRLPVHEQSGYYIRLFVKEFPELESLVGNYLVSKIFTTYKSKKNYLVIGGCTEALANIGAADISYFNTNILPIFLRERSIGADYCLAMLLKQLYIMPGSKKFVIQCAEQWGHIKNNPHCTLTVLYLCSMVGGQEYFVRDVWDSILDAIIKEIFEEPVQKELSYFRKIQELFRSGNQETDFFKGVIHAFFSKVKYMEKEKKRTEKNLLGTLFLLFVLDDYECCNLSGYAKRQRDMIWIQIFNSLDKRTGQELAFLWALVLKHRQHPKEGWNILEGYLAEYKTWDGSDLDRLAFFFYWVNRAVGNDQAYSFLKRCASQKCGRLQIADKIYERIMKESRNGRKDC